MQTENPILIARGLIERHGIRAVAVAEGRLEEARLSRDPGTLEHWQAVLQATTELRRTGRQAEPKAH